MTYRAVHHDYMKQRVVGEYDTIDQAKTWARDYLNALMDGPDETCRVVTIWSPGYACVGVVLDDANGLGAYDLKHTPFR